MPFDIDRVETITFDSFSTIVFAREWHSRAADYGRVSNYIDTYGTYYELHRVALEYLLAAEGVSASDDELDEMNAVYHDIEPFDDVRSGVELLRDAGFDVGIVTNGDSETIESLLRVTDLGDLISESISADEIERHKPARELYEYAAERLDTDPSAMAHVSNGYMDVQGAMHTGMQGVWLDRQERPPDPFGPIRISRSSR